MDRTPILRQSYLFLSTKASAAREKKEFSLPFHRAYNPKSGMRVWTIHLESSINETQGNPVQDFCGILVGECHVLLTRHRNWKYELFKLKNLLTQKLTFRLLREKS